MTKYKYQSFFQFMSTCTQKLTQRSHIFEKNQPKSTFFEGLFYLYCKIHEFMNSWNHESMPWASTYYFKCSSVAHKHSKEEHIVFLFHFEITSKKNLSIILQGKWRNLYIILHQLHLLHPLNPHKLKPTKGWRIERILMDLDASIWY